MGDESLHNALHRLFGFTEFRPGQQEAIDSLLVGQHTLVVMPTGAGKSLIYQLATMCIPQPAVTLVLSPLIALMKDQVDSLNRRDIPATYINSTQSLREQTNRLQGVVEGAYRLVYVAPERLRSVQFQQAMRRITIGLLAVDEAHCISHWGHDFRPDYRRIALAREEMGNPLTVALTATATTLVQDDIVNLLHIPEAHRIVTGFNRPNLSFEVCYASDHSSKFSLLDDLLASFKQTSPQSNGEGIEQRDGNAEGDSQTNGQNHVAATTGTAIIYTGTRRDAESVAAYVRQQLAIRASHYHAGLPGDQRTTIQEDFLKGNLPVVVATNAFGMGIDRPDVRLVVHYAMPGTLEAYYQEAGRAGRDGKPSRAVLLYSPQDRMLQQWFIEKSAATFGDLRALYRVLHSPKQQQVQTSLEQLAAVTHMDPVKVRVGLAHLEQAGVLKHSGDEGATIQITVATWDDDAVDSITDSIDAYSQHRQAQLDQITDYAEADSCRRKILLRYFSDHSEIVAPRCCDNCIVAQDLPTERQDVANLSRAERATLVILDALRRLQWNIGRKRLAEILKGSKSKGMSEYYRKSTYYGRFAEFSLKDIEDMIEQLVLAGYLKIIGGDMPVLELTRRGELALKTRSAFALELPGAGERSSGGKKRKRYATSGTTDETETLFQQGNSPSEIAQARGLTERTIFKHLASLVGEGRIALADVVADEVVAQVQSVIAQVNDISRLAPLKERLPESISYDELRCVVEDEKRRREEQAGA